MAKGNKIRQKELSEELQEEMSDELEQRVEQTEHFIKAFFSRKRISSYLVAKNLPFVGFLALLGILYITNRHLAENTVRRIERLGAEVKELGWDYKSLNAELMKLTTQTEIAKRADTLGVKERTEPPIKLGAWSEKEE